MIFQKVRVIFKALALPFSDIAVGAVRAMCLKQGFPALGSRMFGSDNLL